MSESRRRSSCGATVKAIQLVLVLVTAVSGAHAVEPVTASTTALPAPVTDGSFSVERALHERRSWRDPAPTPLALAQVGQLCWAAQGVTDDKGHRTAPSAMAVYPLDLYVLAGAVTDLAPPCGARRRGPGRGLAPHRLRAPGRRRLRGLDPGGRAAHRECRPSIGSQRPSVGPAACPVGPVRRGRCPRLWARQAPRGPVHPRRRRPDAAAGRPRLGGPPDRRAGRTTVAAGRLAGPAVRPRTLEFGARGWVAQW